MSRQTRRRNLIKTLGAVGVGVSIAGCSTARDVITQQSLEFSAQPAVLVSPADSRLESYPYSAAEVSATATRSIAGIQREFTARSFGVTHTLSTSSGLPAGEAIAFATPKIDIPGAGEQNPAAELTADDVLGEFKQVDASDPDGDSGLVRIRLDADSSIDRPSLVKAGYTGTVGEITDLTLEKSGDGVRGRGKVNTHGDSSEPFPASIAARKIEHGDDYVFMIGWTRDVRTTVAVGSLGETNYVTNVSIGSPGDSSEDSQVAVGSLGETNYVTNVSIGSPGDSSEDSQVAVGSLGETNYVTNISVGAAADGDRAGVLIGHQEADCGPKCVTLLRSTLEQSRSAYLMNSIRRLRMNSRIMKSRIEETSEALDQATDNTNNEEDETFVALGDTRKDVDRIRQLRSELESQLPEDFRDESSVRDVELDTIEESARRIGEIAAGARKRMAEVDNTNQEEDETFTTIWRKLTEIEAAARVSVVIVNAPPANVTPD